MGIGVQESKQEATKIVSLVKKKAVNIPDVSIYLNSFGA